MSKKAPLKIELIPEGEDEEDTFEWTYGMGDNVKLTMSGEAGVVSGRQEKFNCQDEYEITYVDGSGRLVRKWWPDGALEPIGTLH
jgi:hypothetical protein